MPTEQQLGCVRFAWPSIDAFVFFCPWLAVWCTLQLVVSVRAFRVSDDNVFAHDFANAAVLAFSILDLMCRVWLLYCVSCLFMILLFVCVYPSVSYARMSMIVLLQHFQPFILMC